MLNDKLMMRKENAFFTNKFLSMGFTDLANVDKKKASLLLIAGCGVLTTVLSAQSSVTRLALFMIVNAGVVEHDKLLKVMKILAGNELRMSQIFSLVGYNISPIFEILKEFSQYRPSSNVRHLNDSGAKEKIAGYLKKIPFEALSYRQLIIQEKLKKEIEREKNSINEKHYVQAEEVISRFSDRDLRSFLRNENSEVVVEKVSKYCEKIYKDNLKRNRKLTIDDYLSIELAASKFLVKQVDEKLNLEGKRLPVAMLLAAYKENPEFICVKCEQFDWLFKDCNNIDWRVVVIDDQPKPEDSEEQTIAGIKKLLIDDESFNEKFFDKIVCQSANTLQGELKIVRKDMTPQEFSSKSVKGGAMLLGMLWCANNNIDAIVTADANGSMHMSGSGKQLYTWHHKFSEGNENQVVIGSRYMSSSHVFDRGESREALSTAFRYLADVFSPLEKCNIDRQAPVKIYSANAVKGIISENNCFMLKMAYDSFLLSKTDEIASVPRVWKFEPANSSSADQAQSMLLEMFEMLVEKRKEQQRPLSGQVSRSLSAEERLREEGEYQKLKDLASNKSFKFIVNNFEKIYLAAAPVEIKRIIKGVEDLFLKLASGDDIKESVSGIINSFIYLFTNLEKSSYVHFALNLFPEIFSVIHMALVDHEYIPEISSMILGENHLITERLKTNILRYDFKAYGKNHLIVGRQDLSSRLADSVASLKAEADVGYVVTIRSYQDVTDLEELLISSSEKRRNIYFIISEILSDEDQSLIIENIKSNFLISNISLRSCQSSKLKPISKVLAVAAKECSYVVVGKEVVDESYIEIAEKNDKILYLTGNSPKGVDEKTLVMLSTLSKLALSPITGFKNSLWASSIIISADDLTRSLEDDFVGNAEVMVSELLLNINCRIGLEKIQTYDPSGQVKTSSIISLNQAMSTISGIINLRRGKYFFSDIFGAGAEHTVYLNENQVVKIPNVSKFSYWVMTQIFFSSRHTSQAKKITFLPSLMEVPAFREHVSALRSWKELNAMVMLLISAYEGKGSSKGIGVGLALQYGKELVAPFSVDSDTNVKFSMPAKILLKDKFNQSEHLDDMKTCIDEAVLLFEKSWLRGLFDLDTNIMQDLGYFDLPGEEENQLLCIDPGEMCDNLASLKYLDGYVSKSSSEMARKFELRDEDFIKTELKKEIEKTPQFIEMKAALEIRTNDELDPSQIVLDYFVTSLTNFYLNFVLPDYLCFCNNEEVIYFGGEIRKDNGAGAYSIQHPRKISDANILKDSKFFDSTVRDALVYAGNSYQRPFIKANAIQEEDSTLEGYSEKFLSLRLVPIGRFFNEGINENVEIRNVELGIQPSIDALLHPGEKKHVLMDAGKGSRLSIIGGVEKSKGQVTLGNQPNAQRTVKFVNDVLAKFYSTDIKKELLCLTGSDEYYQGSDKISEALIEYFSHDRAPGMWWADLDNAGRGKMPCTVEDFKQYFEDNKSKVTNFLREFVDENPLLKNIAVNGTGVVDLFNVIMDSFSKHLELEKKAVSGQSPTISVPAPILDLLKKFLIFNGHLDKSSPGMKTPFIMFFQKEFIHEFCESFNEILSSHMYIMEEITWENLLVRGLKCDRLIWSSMKPSSLPQDVWSKMFASIQHLKIKWNISTIDDKQNSLRVFRPFWHNCDDPVSIMNLVKSIYSNKGGDYFDGQSDVALFSDLPLHKPSKIIKCKAPVQVALVGCDIKGKVYVDPDLSSLEHGEIAKNLLYKVSTPAGSNLTIPSNHLCVTASDQKIYSVEMGVMDKSVLNSQSVFCYEYDPETNVYTQIDVGSFKTWLDRQHIEIPSKRMESSDAQEQASKFLAVLDAGSQVVPVLGYQKASYVACVFFAVYTLGLALRSLLQNNLSPVSDLNNSYGLGGEEFFNNFSNPFIVEPGPTSVFSLL